MSLIKKLNDFVFGADEDGDEEVVSTTDSIKEEYSAPPRFSPSMAPQATHVTRKGNSSSNKVAYIHATTQLEVFILGLESYDEAQEIIDHLKSKNAVVVNLEKLTKETAQNVLDFVSGAVYALDANIQRVAAGTFLVAPYTVGITNDVRAELKSKGIFSGMMKNYD